MNKIKKLLLPIASVIGMTACIAPMAACNTTATTVAKTNAATKINSGFECPEIIIVHEHAKVGSYEKKTYLGQKWGFFLKPTITPDDGYAFTGRWINRDTKKYMTDDFVFDQNYFYCIDPEILPINTVQFTAMPETIRGKTYSSRGMSNSKTGALPYEETQPWGAKQHFGFDEPKFANNELIFRNSQKNSDGRFITEKVRVDIVVPAKTTRKTQVNIDEYVTSACNGYFMLPCIFDSFSEVFALKDENDHPNNFMDWCVERNIYNIQKAIQRQIKLESDRRLGDLHWLHAQKSCWYEWHENANWKDSQITYTDVNTTDSAMLFTHYIEVSANTLGTYAIWYEMPNRECGYRFAFSAQEVNK